MGEVDGRFLVAFVSLQFLQHSRFVCHELLQEFLLVGRVAGRLEKFSLKDSLVGHLSDANISDASPLPIESRRDDHLLPVGTVTRAIVEHFIKEVRSGLEESRPEGENRFLADDFRQVSPVRVFHPIVAVDFHQLIAGVSVENF